MPGSADDFRLDAPLPRALAIGRGAVLALRARLYNHASRARALRVSVDGREQRFPPRGRLRFDVHELRPYVELLLPIAIEGRRAGTTAMVRVEAIDDGKPELLVEQSIALYGPTEPPPPLETPIAICLATYNPDAQLLARQIESLRQQTRRDFTCIVQDDCSAPEHWQEVQRIVDGDRRFRLHRNDSNRGFYRNFEAALSRVPPATPYIAFCDQDDNWYPDKLAESVARLDASPRAQLVYSDMRDVDGLGAVISPTFWTGRRNNFRAFDTLLIANSVTGAASMFRGSLLPLALPFPPEQGVTFHDHWLACVAFVAGGLEYIDRPLYDYTQHGASVIGHSEFSAPTPLASLGRLGVAALKMAALPPLGVYKLLSMPSYYHVDYRRLAMFAETLRLRFSHVTEDVARAFELFDDSWARAFELILPVHARILRRGDTTNMEEICLGLGMLVHRTTEPLLASLATQLFDLPRPRTRRS